MKLRGVWMFYDMLKMMLRFLWHRDSESCVLLTITIAPYMKFADLDQMASYLHQAAWYHKRMASDADSEKSYT